MIEYAKMMWRLKGEKDAPDMGFHHIDFPDVGDVAVEMHFRPMFCDSPLRCYRFLKWCRENEQFGVCDALINGFLQTVFSMPDEYLICQPNEKEGKFLLNEIMQAGNFGKYDMRTKKPPSIPLLRGKKVPQHLWHAIEKTKHNLRLLTHYPEEVLWEPFFRVYHWVWRKLELWRW